MRILRLLSSLAALVAGTAWAALCRAAESSDVGPAPSPRADPVAPACLCLIHGCHGATCWCACHGRDESHAIGDTYTHESHPGAVFTVQHEARGAYELRGAHCAHCATAAELRDPAGPWRRCPVPPTSGVMHVCDTCAELP